MQVIPSYFIWGQYHCTTAPLNLNYQRIYMFTYLVESKPVKQEVRSSILRLYLFQSDHTYSLTPCLSITKRNICRFLKSQVQVWLSHGVLKRLFYRKNVTIALIPNLLTIGTILLMIPICLFLSGGLCLHESNCPSWMMIVIIMGRRNQNKMCHRTSQKYFYCHGQLHLELPENTHRGENYHCTAGLAFYWSLIFK